MSLSLAALDIAIPEVTTNLHPIQELTTEALNGTGIFDVLMRTVKLHLKDEYDSRRITGKEYAQVYIGSLTAVLQQAVGYTLQQVQVEKTQAELALLRQKTVTELAQTQDTITLGLGFNDGTAVSGNIGRQKELYLAQTAGFSRDAEQKLAKLMTEVWAVQKTMDEGMLVPSTLDNASIDVVMNRAATGIGIPTL